jgi:bacillopeptidase F
MAALLRLLPLVLLLHPQAQAQVVHRSIDLDDDQTPHDVMLTLRGKPSLDEIVMPAQPRSSSSSSSPSLRAERRTAVHRHLTAWTDRAQRCVRGALARHHNASSVVPFWIVNALSVRGVRGTALRAVLADCDQDVARIDPMGFYRRHRSVRASTPPPPPPDTQAGRRGDGLQWNIQKIGAPQAWNNGVDGHGVVVATLDGGVRYTHEALVGNYRGTTANQQFNHDYNW